MEKVIENIAGCELILRCTKEAPEKQKAIVERAERAIKRALNEQYSWKYVTIERSDLMRLQDNFQKVVEVLLKVSPDHQKWIEKNFEGKENEA